MSTIITGPVDAFQRTRKLIGALKIIPPADRWLTDRYFSNRVVSDSDTVEVEVVKRGRRMASFVNPRSQAKTVERVGSEIRFFRPPYIKEKKEITPDDKLLKRFGETVYDVAPEERLAEVRAEELDELRTRIDRRIEWMCAKALFEGKVVVVGEGVNAEIDFGRSAANDITLSGAQRWGQSGMDVRATFLSAARPIRDDGLRPDDVILGSDAVEALLANQRVRDLLDNRRTEAGQLTLTNLPSNVEYIGNLFGLELYAYHEVFVDDDTNTSEPLVPAKEILVASRGAMTRLCFGVIQDLRSNAAVEYFPKTYQTEDPSAEWIMLQSAPLPVPMQIDGFTRVRVMD